MYSFDFTKLNVIIGEKPLVRSSYFLTVFKKEEIITLGSFLYTGFNYLTNVNDHDINLANQLIGK